MYKFIRGITSLMIFAIFSATGLTGHYMYNLPDNYLVTKGEELKINSFFEITAHQEVDNNVFRVNSNYNTRENVTLKLFGTIPIKSVAVTSVERPVLVAGGNPFGLKMLTQGVLVVDVSTVDTKEGAFSPASNSGLIAGDVITSINDEEIFSNSDLQNLMKSSGGNNLKITYIRDEKEMITNLTPVYSISDACYKAGLWVRDSSAGIGTITYYDPSTEMFGGLGHPICDSDTGEILPLKSGEVVDVTINGVKKGEPKNPGELIGSFISGFPIGEIYSNENTGIFGQLDNAPNLSSPIPIAFKQEVQEGEATILTTISGNSPKEYDIIIESVRYDENEQSKNMVVQIVDVELLEATGGILQGMSGSPIVQNGKLIGAVTHVFVNDPTRGYGIFIENMLESAESIGE